MYGTILQIRLCMDVSQIALIHKQPHQIVLISRSYWPENQGKESLSLGIHQIRSSIKKIVLKERHNCIETLVSKSKMCTVFYSLQIYSLWTKQEERKRNLQQLMKNSTGYPSELQDVGPTQGGVVNGDHQHVGLFGGEQRLTDKLRVALSSLWVSTQPCI